MSTLNEKSNANIEDKQLEERLLNIVERNQYLDQALKKILDAVNNPKARNQRTKHFIH
ncbi:hypothetical protein MASR2M12_08030 [Bacteroidales bacterium]